MKICSKCKTKKNKTEFNKHKQKKDGLNSQCRECTKQDGLLQTAKNKERKSEYDKKYRQDNLDKLNSKSLLYRLENKDKKRAYDKQYRDKLGEKRLASKRDYYHNKGGKENMLKWRILNPDKIKSHNSNTGARRREVIKTSTLSGSKLLKWDSYQPKICTYCNKICHSNYQIDHIDPLAKGGKHELENLTIACTKCNQSKRATTLIVWLAKKVHDRINRS